MESIRVCHHCDENIDYGDDLCSELNGEIYCRDCYYEEFSVCDNCERECYIEDMRGGVCDDCYEEGNNGERHSGGWSYHGQDSDLYYGIELEVGANIYLDLKQKFNQSLNEDFFDIHSDCSILENGVCDEAEIVSHPATYKWLLSHKDLWEFIFQGRHSSVISYNTNTCGMHIHLSRSYFSDAHLERLLRMVYNQPTFTYLISQRRNNELQRWGSLYHYGKRWTKKEIKNKVGYNSDRYEAVNLTNGDTIELRFFRGTLKERSFWKNVEYTHALVEFTKITTRQDDLTLKCFINFILKNKEMLPNLYKWIVARRNKLKQKDNKEPYTRKKVKRIMQHLEIL